MTYFTADQVNLLLKPIHPRRVLQRDGMSYVEGYDIKAELNRVFGFGRWNADILDQALICETAKKMGNGRDGWYVAYRTSLRLTIKAPDGTEVCHYDESHVGESTHPVQGEAHGNALTNSYTYALKRCATNLGDQFGLSLYGKGSREALVRWTLVRPESGEEKAAVDDDDVPQVTAESEPSPEPQQQPPANVQDDVLGTWAAKLDEITTAEDAERVSAEVNKAHSGGVLDSRRASAVHRAIRDKVASLGRQQHERTVPDGNDSDWIAHFAERLRVSGGDDDLSSLQSQVGIAVKAGKITPAKSADLSKAIQQRRRELEKAGAPA